MIVYGRAIELMQQSMSGLYRAGLLKEDPTVSDDTVLLGTGSTLDSIAFVTFVTDLEDRLSRETNQDIALVLSAIHEFNPAESALRANALARYVVQLTGG